MFSEYEHMENHYNILKYVIPELVKDVRFVALEKIHGTNYSFLCDGSNIIPCKRSSSLGSDRSYYGHGIPFEKYSKDILKMFQLVLIDYPNLKQIQLYCELFGGNFKGKTEKGYKCVQKNTNYLALNEILAYDMKITMEDKSFIYLDMEYLMKLFQNNLFSIKLVPIVKIGTFDEIIQLNPKFITHVPNIYGLEQISDNFAEGYVIKPMKEMIFQDDEKSRFIFKYKNPNFSEIECKNKNIEIKEKIMTNQQICFEKLKTYVTENRFNNIVTKYYDDWTNTNIDSNMELLLINAMLNDIKTDYFKDCKSDEKYDTNCFDSNEKQLNGYLTGFVKKIIKNKKI